MFELDIKNIQPHKILPQIIMADLALSKINPSSA